MDSKKCHRKQKDIIDIEDHKIKIKKEKEDENGKEYKNNELDNAYIIKRRKKFFPVKNLYDPTLLIKGNDFYDRYVCGLCSGFCIEPRYLNCGCDKAYCKKCLNVYYDYRNNRCPICIKKVTHILPLNLYENNIQNLELRCINYKYCSWKGHLKDYKNHLLECPYEIINCPKKKCVFKGKRKFMSEHLISCHNIKIKIKKEKDEEE